MLKKVLLDMKNMFTPEDSLLQIESVMGLRLMKGVCCFFDGSHTVRTLHPVLMYTSPGWFSFLSGTLKKSWSLPQSCLQNNHQLLCLYPIFTPPRSSSLTPCLKSHSNNSQSSTSDTSFLPDAFPLNQLALDSDLFVPMPMVVDGNKGTILGVVIEPSS